MCRGRERLTCHRCWNVGCIILNVIIHLSFNYFYDTSNTVSRNKISFKLAFSSAFITLKLLCKHCSITSVSLSKSYPNISVHVVKTSNGQAFNDYRYCKNVLSHFCPYCMFIIIEWTIMHYHPHITSSLTSLPPVE